MDFADALIAAFRHGKKVRRQRWRPTEHILVRSIPHLDDIPSSVACVKYIYVYPVRHRMEEGWSAHYEDAIANDWEEYVTPKEYEVDSND